jgi:hypothetical protein
MSNCNRIILIGNGFDLAHGLKTSYTDFINWYWDKEYKAILKVYSECPEIDIFEWETEIYCFKSADPKGYGKSAFIPRCGEELRKLAVLKNRFWKRIENELETPYWSGIEDLYYKCLNECRLSYDKERELGIKPEITKLNEDFSSIKGLFEDFLKTYYDNEKNLIWNKQVFNIEGRINYMPDMLEAISKGISFSDSGYKPRIVLLSFNYTKTPELYEKELNRKGIDTKTIYIHGQLFSKNNPIIFGYGDEMAQESYDIVESKQNEFLKYSKSVLYFQSGQYQNLMQLLKKHDEDKEFEDYEIFIFGHSCANGDRTILRFLFENEHCLRIKYFHYNGYNGIIDFTERSSNIYRIFGDSREEKYQSRMLLKPFDEEDSIPQFNMIEEQIKQSNDTIIFDDYSFKRIDGGWFEMNDNTNKDRRIYAIVDTFYLSMFEVTQIQYYSIMKKNPSHFLHQQSNIPNYINSSHLPVENVSWYDGIRFCNALSEKYGLNKYYCINDNTDDDKNGRTIVTVNPDGNGFRLPTEREWEYAAKGGLKNKTAFDFSGSDDINNVAWYNDDKLESRTHIVGTKEPNELGLYDMNGNLWEWCWDDYLEEPTETSSEQRRKKVLRGGSWAENDRNCTIYCRQSAVPELRLSDHGLRIILSIPQNDPK